MNAWLISLGFTAALWASPAADDQAAASQAIERAVGELGDMEFPVRQRAVKFLWEQGAAAEPALERAADSRDLEIRLQARRILEDFRYGILPGVPADILALIREFRDGDARQRQAALQKLATREQFATLQRLIQLEPDPDVRRQLLVQLMENPRAVEKFIEGRGLESLIALIAADRDEGWRRTVLAQVLFTPAVLQHLAEKGRLEELTKLIEGEQARDVRRQMLALLFQNGDAVAVLIEKDQLEFVLKMIAQESDKSVRASWLSQMLSSPQSLAPLVAGRRLEKLLEYAKQNLEPAERSSLYQQLAQNQAALTVLLDSRGLDGLLALVAAESDAVGRGRQLAALMGSSAVRQRLTDRGFPQAALELARKEKDAAARGEYLRSLLLQGGAAYLFRDAESRKELWQLIRAEQEQTWRPDVVLQLLNMGSPETLLVTKDDAEWLLRFARDELSVEQRHQLLQRLSFDGRSLPILIRHGLFDPLLALARSVQANVRGPLLARLAAGSDGTGHLVSAKQIGLLVSLAKDETDAGARRGYLSGLFRSHPAMSALVAAGHYETLTGLVQAEKDLVKQAELFGDFLQTDAVLQRMADRKQLNTLVEYAQKAPGPEAKREYLRRLFGSPLAAGRLIDQGQFDALFALADKEADRPSRVVLLGAFYANERLVQRLVEQKRVEQVLQFLQQDADAGVRRQVLQRLGYNQAALQAIAGIGQIETLLTLCRQEPEKYVRGSLLSALLASPHVVQYFVDRKQTDKFLEWLRSEPDAGVRRQILQNVAMRSEVLVPLIAQGRFEDLLAILQQDAEPSMRGYLLASVVTRPEVIQRLAADKRLDAVVQLARAQEPPFARRQFLQRLCSNPACLAPLLEQGFLDALLEVAGSDPEPAGRAATIGQLLANPKTVKHLVAGGKVGLLLELASKQDTMEARRAFLAPLLASEPAVAAVVTANEFGRLFELCRSSADGGSSRLATAQLLLSPLAVRQLSQVGGLEQVVREMLAEPDANLRAAFLERLLARPPAVDELVNQGQFAAIFKAAEAEADVVRRRRILGNVLQTPRAIRALAAEGWLDAVFDFLVDSSGPDGIRLSLGQLVYNDEGLRALAAAGRSGRLLELILRTPEVNSRASLLGAFASHPATLRQLAAAGQLDNLMKVIEQEVSPEPSRRVLQRLLYEPAATRVVGEAKLGDELVAWLKAELDPQSRASYVNNALQNPRLWQAILAGGQAEVLGELAALEPDATLRQAGLQRMAYSPSGLVAFHVQRGEHDRALQLLEQHADNDLGRLRLATYLLVTGQIEPRLADVRQRLEQTPCAGDARLLVYLARASGDLSTARQAAEQAGDAGLLKAVLVEQRAWAAVAAKQAAAPCPLPIPVVERPPQNAAWQRVEQLSLLAAYQRLAGAQQDFDKTIAELDQLAAADPNDIDVRWMCVEGLLLNDRCDQGLKLLESVFPERAFDLLCYRHQYGQALELAGWRDGTAANRPWLDALPISGRKSPEPAVQRLTFGLRVARILHRLGDRDAAKTVVEVLETYAQEQPDTNNSNSPRCQCWQVLCAALIELGEPQRGWEIGARAMQTPEDASPVLSHVYQRRGGEAYAWWEIFRRRHPAEPPLATFLRIGDVLDPPPDRGARELAKLVSEVEPLIPTLPVVWHGHAWLAVAAACQRCGLRDLELRCLTAASQLPQPPDQADSLLADALRRNQRWAEAAEQYEKVWQNNRERLGALYLSGDALERSGRAEDGRRRKEQASQMALDSRARRELALALKSQGLDQEAEDQFRLVLRTAPFEHWEWNDAAEQWGNRLAQDQPAEAADWLQYALLDDLRWNHYLLNNHDYLRAPSAIHRLRAAAAVRAGDLEQASREIELALAATPADTQLAQDMVPLLEQTGRQPQADELFGKVVTAISDQLQRYPRSALLHNNLAWVSARCDRCLDDALQHARRAVELDPDNAAYLDTLAESHFRLGDRDTAVRHSRRAVELRPQDTTLQEQLRRFEQAPLPEQGKQPASRGKPHVRE